MGDLEKLFGMGEKAAKIGILAVSIIGSIKGVVGLYVGSLSLLAQSIDSVTDLFSMIAVYIGIRLSRKPPSKRFPYGYYRFETLASLIIAVLIFLTGSEILRESILRLLNPQPITAPLYALIVAASSTPILYVLSKHTKKVGEEINSKALIGQAADFRADIYSSSLVLVGVFSSVFGYPFVEGIVGSVISVFVLKVGATLAWQGLLVLMDAVENPETIIEIKKIVEEVRGVREASRIRIRRSGPFCMGELTIGVDQRLSVEQAHRVSEDVERRVKEEIPVVESLIIHIEPQAEKRLRLAIPILDDKGLSSPVTPHFGEAPYFLFIDVENGVVERWFTRRNTALDLERRRGVTISELIIEEETTTLLTAEIGEGPFHILRDSFVEIYELPEKVTAADAVNIFIEGKMKSLEDASEGKRALNETNEI